MNLANVDGETNRSKCQYAFGIYRVKIFARRQQYQELKDVIS